MIKDVSLESILLHLSLQTRLKFLVYDIVMDIEPDLTPEATMEKVNNIQDKICEAIDSMYDETIYTNSEMLSMITESIDFKTKPVSDLLQHSFEQDKMDNLVNFIKENVDKYDYYLEIILELKRLHDLASYFESYELVNEYFKGEEMQYTDGVNIPYVLLIQLICKYKYYKTELDNNGKPYFDKDFVDNWIIDIFTDLNNDAIKHRDIPGSIEMARSLSLINNNDYTYLMDKFNEIKDIKKDHVRINEIDPSSIQ